MDQELDTTSIETQVDVPVTETEVSETANETESTTESRDSDAQSVDKDKFSDPKVESAFQNRLERERRKLRREMESQSSNNYGQQNQYAQQQPQQGNFQPQTQYQGPDLSHLTPEQRNEYQQAQALIRNEAIRAVRAQEAEREATSFLEKMQDEASRDPNFDDFMKYDIRRDCTAMMLETSRVMNDPRILFEFSQQNPTEFRKLARLDPVSLAIKLGEFRGKKSVPVKKLTSSAPRPINEPSPSAPYVQKSKSEDYVRDELRRRRAGK